MLNVKYMFTLCIQNICFCLLGPNHFDMLRHLCLRRLDWLTKGTLPEEVTLNYISGFFFSLSALSAIDSIRIQRKHFLNLIKSNQI